RVRRPALHDDDVPDAVALRRAARPRVFPPRAARGRRAPARGGRARAWQSGCRRALAAREQTRRAHLVLDGRVGGGTESLGDARLTARAALVGRPYASLIASNSLAATSAGPVAGIR